MPIYASLRDQHSRPAPFSRYTADTLWTDAHIASRMLAYHLDPESDLASRRPETIDGIISWMDGAVGFSGKAICDLGCGPGLYATRMAERGARVTGIDFSAGSLAHARDAAAKAGLAIDYRQGDYLAGDLPEDQDLVCLIYGDLCALSPVQRRVLYGKVHRALKPGGAFICDVSSAAQFAEREETVAYGRRFMDGFWAAGDYFAFLNTFLYDDLKLALDRYLIVEPGRTRDVFNWLQYFEPATLSDELAEAGFGTEAVVDALTGEDCQNPTEMFAVIARKR